MPDPEVSDPVSLEEIHEVLGSIEALLESRKPSWDAVAGLSLYVIALAVVRVLEARESRS